MRSRIARWSLIALLLVLACGSASYAAITEKYCLDGINDTVAVLRYYHRLATDAQYNLELCLAARALTESQLSVEKALFAEAKSKAAAAQAQLNDAKAKAVAELIEDAKNKATAATEQADFFQQRVTRLEHQLGRLADFKYEDTYNKRMNDSRVQIARLEAKLASHVAEYELLFGKKAHAQTNFAEEMAKYRPHRENMAGYLVLDY